MAGGEENKAVPLATGVVVRFSFGSRAADVGNRYLTLGGILDFSLPEIPLIILALFGCVFCVYLAIAQNKPSTGMHFNRRHIVSCKYL